MAKTQQLSQGYNIELVGRHVQVTDAMKSYVIEKLSKLDKFHNRVIDIAVTLDIQKLEHRVVLVMKVDHTKIKVQASSEDMYASIDKATDRLLAKFRRYRESVKDHRATPLGVVDINVNVFQRKPSELDLINDEIEEANQSSQEQAFHPHEIVKTEMQAMKTLTPEEAVFHMDLSDDSFMVYRDEVDQRIKVIYRRSDGNYGVIEPE